jgi:peptide maturation system protein (TIGR04066 family)
MCVVIGIQRRIKVGRKKILRVAMFPYDDEMYPYLRCSSMLDGIKIQFLLSPKSWGVENENVCGYDIQSCLSDEDYEKFDALWLCDSMGEMSDDNLISMTEDMLSKDKQLIITRKLKPPIHERLLDIVGKHSGTVVDYNKNPSDIDVSDKFGFLDHIMTPIISVSGPGEHTDKFLTQLLLKEYLEKNGKKVVLISSRSNSEIIKGAYSFPEFMSANISTERKIILYNRLVKSIERQYNPDYIIVGIQGGILPSLNINVWNFELYPYAIFKAIKPRYSIMCLYANYVSSEYLHELRQTMKYKFDADVDFFYRSSTTPNMDQMLGKTRPIQLDETAYIYDDISKICANILKK